MKYRISFILGVVLLGAMVAQAGTPLTCFPFNIGDAKSLPVSSAMTAGRPFEIDPSYDTKHLATDTLALLGPETPVLVRMETIRRAAIYARQDEHARTDLLEAIRARSEHGDNALALFDYGYLVETFKQMDTLNPLVASVDGYSKVAKAIQLRGGDAQMEFAAALITAWPKSDKHEAHFQKAVAGAVKDPLLATNVLSLFSNRGSTLAQLRNTK